MAVRLSNKTIRTMIRVDRNLSLVNKIEKCTNEMKEYDDNIKHFVKKYNKLEDRYDEVNKQSKECNEIITEIKHCRALVNMNVNRFKLSVDARHEALKKIDEEYENLILN
jgi:hypothetical protein